MPCNLSTAQQDERLLFLKGLSQWKTADPDYLALPASLYLNKGVSEEQRQGWIRLPSSHPANF